MTSLRSMITSSKKGLMVTIARSVPGCCQPSWHRWHGLPTMGWLKTGGGRERESLYHVSYVEGTKKVSESTVVLSI